MQQKKTEAVNLRMTPEIKQLLRQAAVHERRTISNMVEILVLAYCEQHGIEALDNKLASPSLE
jgi:uncharacterized protein (DUF1778 family)